MYSFAFMWKEKKYKWFIQVKTRIYCANNLSLVRQIEHKPENYFKKK